MSRSNSERSGRSVIAAPPARSLSFDDVDGLRPAEPEQRPAASRRRPARARASSGRPRSRGDAVGLDAGVGGRDLRVDARRRRRDRVRRDVGGVEARREGPLALEVVVDAALQLVGERLLVRALVVEERAVGVVPGDRRAGSGSRLVVLGEVLADQREPTACRRARRRAVGLVREQRPARRRSWPADRRGRGRRVRTTAAIAAVLSSRIIRRAGRSGPGPPGPSSRAGTKVSSATINTTPTSTTTNVGESVRNVPAPAGVTRLPTSEPATASTASSGRKRPPIIARPPSTFGERDAELRRRPAGCRKPV